MPGADAYIFAVVLGPRHAVTVLLKSMGVVGDGRRYEWVIALRADETIES